MKLIQLAPPATRQTQARTPRGQVDDSPTRRAGAPCCTTSHHKTHDTAVGAEVAVVYVWHPWAGRRVCLHEVIERATGLAARCSLVDAPFMRHQEIPVWMLDPVACRTVRATQQPVAAWSALTTLHALLADRARGAALASPESRGDHHAAPSSPNPQPTPATRSGPDELACNVDGPAGLVRPAGSDAADADQSPNPPADRPRRRQRSAAGRPSRRRCR